MVDAAVARRPVAISVVAIDLTSGERGEHLAGRVVLSASLYLLFGRNVEVEFRLGIGGGEERRVYGALIWKRRSGVTNSADTYDSAEIEVGTVGRDG